MLSWPYLTTVKRVKGFLGLTCYYSSFIHQYAMIVTFLTDSLMKGEFFWTTVTKEAFV